MNVKQLRKIIRDEINSVLTEVKKPNSSYDCKYVSIGFENVYVHINKLNGIKVGVLLYNKLIPYLSYKISGKFGELIKNMYKDESETEHIYKTIDEVTDKIKNEVTTNIIKLLKKFDNDVKKIIDDSVKKYNK